MTEHNSRLPNLEAKMLLMLYQQSQLPRPSRESNCGSKSDRLLINKVSANQDEIVLVFQNMLKMLLRSHAIVRSQHLVCSHPTWW